MADLRPVQRRSAPDDVAEQLVDGIVAGDLGAGESLPSERDLAERLGVSRPTVRAALARLATAGLVETRQGGGSTVRDFRRHAGLDLLPRLVLGPDGVDVEVVRDVLGARTVLGPQVAALAARRTDPQHPPSSAMAEAADAVARHGDDPVAAQHAAIAFWDAVVDHGGSIVFRLLFNQLRAAFEPAVEALATVLRAETDRPELYAALADAIAGADPGRAGDVAADLLALGAQALADVLGEPDRPAAGPAAPDAPARDRAAPDAPAPDRATPDAPAPDRPVPRRTR